MSIATKDVVTRVANSINILNTYGPSDWLNRIDENKICLISTQDCPLGQIYGSFAQGLTQLRQKGIEVGSNKLAFETFSSETNSQLEKEWLRQINKMKNTATAVETNNIFTFSVVSVNVKINNKEKTITYQEFVQLQKLLEN